MMTTKDIMVAFNVTWRTVQVWRRGYYTRKYKGVTEKVFLLPDHSHLECQWVNKPGTNIKHWEYTEKEVSLWKMRLNDYREQRRSHNG